MVTNVKEKRNTYLLLKPDLHFNSLNEIISKAFISNDRENEKPFHSMNFNLNIFKENKFEKIILLVLPGFYNKFTLLLPNLTKSEISKAVINYSKQFSQEKEPFFTISRKKDKLKTIYLINKKIIELLQDIKNYSKAKNIKLIFYDQFLANDMKHQKIIISETNNSFGVVIQTPDSETISVKLTSDSQEVKTLISSYQSDFPVKIFFDNLSTSNQEDLNKNLSSAEKNEFSNLLNSSFLNNLEHFEINRTKSNINSNWINILGSKLKYLFIILLLNLLPLSYTTYENQKDYNENLKDLNFILNKNIAANQQKYNEISVKDKINNFISIQKTKKIAFFIKNFDIILSKLIENGANYEIEYIELRKEHINLKMKINSYDLLKLNELIKEQFLRFETEQSDTSSFNIKISIND